MSKIRKMSSKKARNQTSFRKTPERQKVQSFLSIASAEAGQ